MMNSRFAGRFATLVLSVLVTWPPVRGLTAAPPASNAPTSDLLLKSSNNGRYLVDQKGDPFLVVGDSPWSLIVQLDEKDRETYLEDRQKRGFNSLIVNLLEHKFCTSPPRTRAGLAPFHTPGDFSTPNDAYFDFAHQVIERAGEHGMVVWLAADYLGYGGGDEGFFRETKAGGREKLRAYGRFVGKRFRDLPNIVWMLGGDYTPEAPDQWVVDELAGAIREEDPTHLMTAHHSPESSAVAAFGEQEWLDINTVYGYEKPYFVRCWRNTSASRSARLFSWKPLTRASTIRRPIRSGGRPTGLCSAAPVASFSATIRFGTSMVRASFRLS